MEVTMARQKSAKSPAEGDRKWLDLPCGPLLLIFEMIGTANTFLSVQLVCLHWWLLAHEPYLYRRIVILWEVEKKATAASFLGDCTSGS